MLHLRYDQGKGKPWRKVPGRDRQELNEVMRMLEEAADQGVPDAQYNLGGMYQNGWSVPQNHPTAAKWFQKAADQGHAQAQYNLGRMYDARASE